MARRGDRGQGAQCRPACTGDSICQVLCCHPGVKSDFHSMICPKILFVRLYPTPDERLLSADEVDAYKSQAKERRRREKYKEKMIFKQ